jgi:hypothetical protein
MSFPTIGEYNQTLISKNGKCLRELSEAIFIPARTAPIKVFAFGSGANAVVFKANYKNKIYGLRCFLNNDSDRVSRAKSISNYLQKVNANWKIDYKFLENEIFINGNSYPLIQMEWSTGKDLNTWVDINLQDNERLNQLQRKLVELSSSLEENNIGHGDIQCGNLLVEEIGPTINLKLIDYDGACIPTLSHLNAIENGRGEFQHPSRKLIHFKPTIDRFSFIVLLTAIELLKHDKSLWKSPLQNGFNTLDNLLFGANDFKNPTSSILIQKARNMKVKSVDFYLNQLFDAINSEISLVKKPILYLIQESTESIINEKNIKPIVSHGFIRIESNVPAIVLSGFNKLGNTPFQISKGSYINKELNISNGRGDVIKIVVKITDSLINVHF